MRRGRGLVLWVVLLCGSYGSLSSSAGAQGPVVSGLRPAAHPDGRAAATRVGGDSLARILRGLENPHRVLYVTAHPDDEDSALIAWMVHGLGAEVRLLTLTRGEGGQNEIGSELFDALGVLRSRELEAARSVDGASQRFSRAFEFGYSFSVEETFDKWHRESIVRDVVRQLREFQPHVLLTMGSEGDGGGQHHQASARIAAEAFELAATGLWPELGSAHETQRLFEQVGSTDMPANTCAVDVGVRDPLLAASYAELGLRARALHKCQGMARLSAPFPSGTSRWKWVRASDSELRVVASPFAGLARGSTRAERDRLAALGPLVDAARGAHRADRPDEALPALLAVWDFVEAPESVAAFRPVTLATLRARIGEAIGLALGVCTAARVARPWVHATERVEVEASMLNSGPHGVALRGRLFGPGGAHVAIPEGDVESTTTRRMVVALDLSAFEIPSTLSPPLPRRANLAEDGRFLEPGWCAFWCEWELAFDGRRIVLPACRVECERVSQRLPTAVLADVHVVPDPSIRLARTVIPVLSGHPLPIDLYLSSILGGTFDVGVDAPPGWQNPLPVRVDTGAGGLERRLRIVLEPAPAPTATRVGTQVGVWARPIDSARTSREGYRWIEYPHTRAAGLLERAEATVVVLSNCKTATTRRVGYVAGVGDEIPAALTDLGVSWEALDDDRLSVGDLDRFESIIVGVRAYKVRNALRAATPRLRAWMERGGRLIVQYQKFEFNDAQPSSPFAPYEGAKVTASRVTVEESPVIANVDGHPLLGFPNQLEDEDWQGWVQERGLYFLQVDDRRYTDLLALEDPWPYNAGRRGGALVHAKVGRGDWIYVGLGLFRQLPAGVPGAYRLLANLLARTPE